MHLSCFPAVFIGGEIVDLVRETGLVAQAAFLALLPFSLVYWGIILFKWAVLKRAPVQNGPLLRAVRRSQLLQHAADASDEFRPIPLVGVYQLGFREFERQVGSSGGLRNPLAVQRAMQIASSEEMTRFERNLPWLAITGAVTPFVGLFGTVWGIIDAFHGLGTSGAATLRAVAPGISEALITTAAGLAAAIPAVIAYNLIGGSIRDFAARCDDFSLEMLNAVERQPTASRMPEEVRR